MSDYLPVNSDVSAITMTASGAITGGSLVMASTGTAGYCNATYLSTQRAIGVAACDAADGARVTVYLLSGFVHEVPVKNTVVATTGWVAVPTDASGRVECQASAQVCLPGTPVGVFVNTTTGTSAGTSGKGRFIGL